MSTKTDKQKKIDEWFRVITFEDLPKIINKVGPPRPEKKPKK